MSYSIGDIVQTWRIIIPILNFEFEPFFEPIWYLSDNVSCQKVSDSDFGALWRYLDNDDSNHYKALITPNTKCIYISDITNEPKEEKIIELAQNQAIITNSIFNFFSENNPIILSYAAILRIEDNEFIEPDYKITVRSIIDLEPVANLHLLRSQIFKLKSSANQERINQFYRVLSDVSKKNPQIFVTLSRFNSSLTRVTDRDRIIDITVSLESLIREKTELSFKFATYLSFIVGKNPQDRLEANILFGNLYNTRSGLVHGTSDEKEAVKNLNKVVSNWSKIIYYAKQAIIYYIFYLYSENTKNDFVEWKLHLKQLMLGIDKRLAL